MREQQKLVEVMYEFTMEIRCVLMLCYKSWNLVPRLKYIWIFNSIDERKKENNRIHTQQVLNTKISLY